MKPRCESPGEVSMRLGAAAAGRRAAEKFPLARTVCPKCGTESVNTTCPTCVVPTEAAPERPNQMSFGEQVVEAIGEHIDARISYAETRRGPSAEFANPDEVNKTAERLQTLLNKVRFAL